MIKRRHSPSMPVQTDASNSTCLLNIILTWGFVFGTEILAGVPDQVVGDLREFLAETVDRLQVHVGLGDQLGKRDFVKLGSDDER